VAEEFDAAGGAEPDVPGSESAVHSALAVDEVYGGQYAGAEHRPHLFFIEWSVVLNSVGNLFLK
jgi:hypothetical protein